MKRIKKMLLVLLIMLAGLLLGAVAAFAQEPAPGPDQWMAFIQHIIAALIVIVPTLSGVLIKVSKVAAKSAEVTKEAQDAQMAVSEALADGDVSNEEIRRVVAESRETGQSAKELADLIMELIKGAHEAVRKH